MGIVELLGLAGSVSLISGWRLYLTVFVTGLAMRLDLDPPAGKSADCRCPRESLGSRLKRAPGLAEFSGDRSLAHSTGIAPTGIPPGRRLWPRGVVPCPL